MDNEKEKGTEKSFFSKQEEETLKFWDENRIFQKSIEQRAKSEKFIFFEGPPTANGKPGIHHVLSRSNKDIICRYKTMRGYQVERKAGWDTHGLPVELQVEKELQLSSKSEIEKFGIAEFNKKCKESVWHYKDEWERLTKRIGFWVDMNNPYITYSNEYIESVWWILSEIHKKGLLYEGYKVVPYCTRCGTGLSSHEVAQGYKTVKDLSVIVKFRITDAEFVKKYCEGRETSFLAWTTTSWSVPTTMALAIGADYNYAVVRLGEEQFVCVKERLSYVMKDHTEKDYKIINEIKGKEMEHISYYHPFYEFYRDHKDIKNNPKVYKTYITDYVSLEDGTGIVTINGAFGEIDMEAVKKIGLPVIVNVTPDGIFMEEMKEFAGMKVKPMDEPEKTDVEIIKFLAHQGTLFRKEKHEHSYPHCWRCGTKLIYYAKQSWFIKMSDEKIKKSLIENNEQVNWVPEYIKEGRMGEWLREVKDWALSRERYWGTPLPIWKCECGEIKVISSIAELEKLSGKKPNDLHRPFIDEVSFKCEKCGGEMVRVKDVIDCWFDSGAMPFAQWHYPFDNKNFIDKNEKFPADYISEAIDQTRGWFYTLLAISTLLDKGPAYKNVVTYGHILDDKGQKMSKSKGNVVDPWLVADKYGIDMLRWYFYTVGAPGEPKRFDFKEMEEIRNKFFRAYWNSLVFYNTYKDLKAQKSDTEAQNILDRWIILELDKVMNYSTEHLEKYDIIRSARSIAAFVDDLSNKYIRFSRDRMRAGDAEAIKTLKEILLKLSKITAPFVPFISEEIYRSVKEEGASESVHLADWPESKEEENEFNKDIMADIPKVFSIINLGRAVRVKSKIQVRQALASLEIQGPKFNLKEKELNDLIKKELNVKEIVFKEKIEEKSGMILESGGEFTIALDTTLTDELREEGLMREMIRQIQDMRKASKYTIKDLAKMYYNTNSSPIKKIIDTYGEAIKQKTILKSIDFVSRMDSAEYDVFKEVKLGEENAAIGLKKIEK